MANDTGRLRYEYDAEGGRAEFDGAFLEFSETGWSRKLRAALLGGTEEEWCAALRRVVRGVHLPLTNGAVIDDADGITPGALAELDDILAGWVSGCIIGALQEVTALGNAERQRLLDSFAGTNSTKTTPAAAPSPTP